MTKSDTEIISLAEALATRVHADQADKASEPYIGHPRRVAAKLESPEAKTIAWLHDVLEDTDVSEAELREGFPDEVVDAVVALTKVADEPMEEYYARVRANPLARQVKHADIHDNLDPQRMALLDETTFQRFAAKYGKAIVEILS